MTLALAQRIGVSAPPTLPRKVANILRKYGSDAHLYTFGPGVPILGPELVVNGDFSNGTTGWASANAGMSVVAGELVVTATTQYGSVTQNVQTKIGATYQLTGVARLGTSTSAYAKVRAESGGTPATQNITSTSSQQLLITFVATSAVTVVEMQNLSAGLGTYVIDAVTFKEILGYSNTYSGFVAGNYFDSAGTTQASVDGSVGLVLDAAGSVGAELSSLYGQTVTGTLYGSQVPNPAIGKVYKITATVNKTSGTAIEIGITKSNFGWHTGQQQLVSANGITNISFYVKAEEAYVVPAVVYTSATGTVTLTSCKEVTGIHASQSTPGYKPTLRRGIVNLLTWSNDLTNAVWGKVATSIVGGQSDPYGGASAQGINDTGANAAHYIQQSYSYIAGSAYSLCRVVKAGGTGFVQIPFESAAFSGNLFANFDLTSGVVGNKSGSVTASIVPLGNGFFLCVASAVATSTASGNTHLWLLNSNGLGFAPAYTGSGGIALYYYASGNFQGTLTAAQILAAGGIPLTTTAPASSQAGVNYAEFDGVDDRLSLPSLGITDACTFVFAITPRAFDTRVIFSSDNAGPQLYLTTGGWLTFDKVGAGTLYSLNAGLQLDTAVVLSVRLAGGVVTIRKNGAVIGTTTSALTFTGTANHSIGAQSAGAYAYKGLLHHFEPLRFAASDVDLAVLEKFVAQLSGVQL